jgi:hypothetical protein
MQIESFRRWFAASDRAWIFTQERVTRYSIYPHWLLKSVRHRTERIIERRRRGSLGACPG